MNLNWRRILKVVAHAIALLFATLLLQSNFYPLGDEQVVISSINQVDHFLVQKKAVNPKEFVFLNVAKSKQLIPAYDENETKVIGNTCITDRKEILSLLETIQKSSCKFLLLDIAFDTPTTMDPALEALLMKQENSIIPFHYDEETKGIIEPAIRGFSASADIRKIGGQHYKYSLLQHGEKTIPLVMYERLHGEEFQNALIGGFLGRDWILNDFILQNRIRPYNILLENNETTIQAGDPSKSFTDGEWLTYDLGEFNRYPEPVKVNILKDKIVIVGDFINDVHDTLSGDIPGSLILTNAYLALKNKDNVITTGFICYLFVIYLFLGWIIMNPVDKFDRFIKRAKNNVIKILLGKSFIIFVLLTIISFTSYFIFGVFVSVFYISVWVIFLDRVISFSKRKTIKSQPE